MESEVFGACRIRGGVGCKEVAVTRNGNLVVFLVQVSNGEEGVASDCRNVVLKLGEGGR